MVFLEGKKEMVERFLMAASMAALVCHPSSTINCFRPKSKTTSKPSKSTNQNDFRTSSSLSRSSVSSSNINIITSSSPPNLATSRSCRDSCQVSNLMEQDPAFGVVETIFRSGWDNKIGLKIEKILKINHNVDVLSKFEEYREMVKSKSASITAGETERLERLAVDGNELLRFHGAVVTCSLGNEEFSRICYKECCGICRMVGSSLSAGEESVSLSNNSRRAHRKVVTESLANKIYARKAIVVCRVIAGRVAQCRGQGLVEGLEGGFDSVVSSSNDKSEGSEELIVLNARAVLPCFVIIYSVKDSKGYKIEQVLKC